MQPLRFLENTSINVKCYKKETFAFGFLKDRENPKRCGKFTLVVCVQEKYDFELTLRLGYKNCNFLLAQRTLSKKSRNKENRRKLINDDDISP